MTAQLLDIWLRTFAYDTGVCDKGSRLLPIELIDTLPHKAGFVEGSLEFRIGGLSILSNESLPCGYIEDWWASSFAAVGDLLALRSTRWVLPGKICHVRIDMLPGTRRARIQAMLRDGSTHSDLAEAHVPTLTDAMLDEAERFFRWLPDRDHSERLRRIEELRRARAPWRH